MLLAASSGMDPTIPPGPGSRLSGMNMHAGNGMVPPYQTVGGGLVMPNRGVAMPGGSMVGVNANNRHLDNASSRERARL